MEKSSFLWYIDKYLTKAAKQWPTRINDSKKAPTYLFKSMLRPEFSPTDQWESFGANQTIVAADYVSLDSELELKKRDSISTFKGDIPKVGMSIPMTESVKKRIRLMGTMGRPQIDMAKLLTNDVQKVISGVWEANEDVFLRLLSDGAVLLDSIDRPGLGIRLTLQVEGRNKIDATTAWTDNTAKTITDLRAVIDVADDEGDVITHLAMTRVMMDFIGASNEGKLLYAASMGKLDAKAADVAIPLRADMMAALEKKLSVKIIDTTRVIRYEKDGKQTKVRPFSDKNITFLTEEQVGTLWYGTVEEAQEKVDGVAYAESDSYILVSKWRNTNPLKEMTASQAVVIPMLDNINSIYWFNSKMVGKEANKMAVPASDKTK